MYRVLLFIVYIVASGKCVYAQTSPDDYYLAVSRADTAMALRQWTKADSLLLEAMRIDSGNSGNILLLSNRGMVQFYAGRFDEAVETLSAAHRMAPASVTILQNRAKVFSQLGKLDMALADYLKVVELDSTLAEPMYYATLIYFHLGNNAAADSMLARLDSLVPDARITQMAHGYIHAYSAHWAEAIPYLSRAIALSQESAVSDIGLRALCYLMVDSLSEAAEDISTALGLDPADPDLYLYRALLNRKRFRPDDARADAERAVQLGASRQRVAALLK